MITNAAEIIGIIVTILAIGYIFSGMIKKPKTAWEQLKEHRLFDWENFKYSAMITAPAIIFHELAHKFVSLAYGIPSFYNVLWWGLGIGVILRVIGSGFIFFIPGYVQVSQAVAPGTMAVIAFAGPATNLALFVISWALIKYNVKPEWNRAFHISKVINLWLFVFNMLPIPPLDGSKVVAGLMGIF